ncbi:hypothetical protein [Indibacter alkaliphilus]|nr:hypothetical protein [Indibacter alkaliphilus]
MMVDLSSPYFWLALGLFLLIYYGLILLSFYRDKLKKAFGKVKSPSKVGDDLAVDSSSPRLIEAFAAYRDYLMYKNKPLKAFPVLLQEPYRGIIKELETNYKSTKLNS